MIAVISDIHGNLPALEAVLADIEATGISRIWCLGDTLGYGPFVNECILLVHQRCELVLAGNHDLAVRGDIDIELFAGSAGAGARYAAEVLDASGRAMLARLSPQRILDEVELYHGSALDPVWEYVRDTRSATSHLQTQRLALSFVGHSHAQLAFGLRDGAGAAAGGLRKPGEALRFELGTKHVVNPGAVGQPRDRDPRAAWADVTEVGVQFHRVAYDIARMRAAVDAAGLPPETGERLELGW